MSVVCPRINDQNGCLRIHFSIETQTTITTRVNLYRTKTLQADSIPSIGEREHGLLLAQAGVFLNHFAAKPVLSRVGIHFPLGLGGSPGILSMLRGGAIKFDAPLSAQVCLLKDTFSVTVGLIAVIWHLELKVVLLPDATCARTLHSGHYRIAKKNTFTGSWFLPEHLIYPALW